jgi:hypothetical protein
VLETMEELECGRAVVLYREEHERRVNVRGKRMCELIVPAARSAHNVSIEIMVRGMQ